MATAISEVYDSFLQKISNYGFTKPDTTQAEIEEEIFGYFKTARTKFYRCKNSLLFALDTNGVPLTDSEGSYLFTVDLHPMEIEVLASLMLVEYIKPRLVTDETIQQALGDKDFKIFSQAGQIREIRLLFQTLKSDARKLITEYTYLDLGQDGDEK